MHKKKILFVIGQLTHGGAEKQLLLLAENINKNLFDFNVICLSENAHPYGNLLKKEGIYVRYIKRRSRFDYKRIYSLLVLFYKIKPDVIISSLLESNIYCFLSRLFYFRKNRYIAQVRSAPDYISGLKKYLNILAYSSANVIITNTNLLVPFILNFLKQNPKKIIIIENGIRNKSKFSSKTFNKNLNIGIVSKDTEVKNIDLFIESSLHVVKKYPKIKFHLCGKGLGIKHRFNMKIKNYKSNYTFYGELDELDILYRKLDIFVLSSLSEGLPNVLLESMSYGLPVVSTDVGGVSEIIKHMENGILVKSEDKFSLSRGLIELIENKKLRKKFSEYSKNFIQDKYSVKEMVNSFEKIFLS